MQGELIEIGEALQRLLDDGNTLIISKDADEGLIEFRGSAGNGTKNRPACGAATLLDLLRKLEGKDLPKTCTACKETKPMSAFATDNRPDGKNVVCKECQRKAARKAAEAKKK